VLTVVIDDPAHLELEKPFCNIKGWVCSAPPSDLALLRFAIGEVPILYTSVIRPDVEEMYPDRVVKGFVLHIDLSYHMHAIRRRELALTVTSRDDGPVHVRFCVSTGAIGSCLAAAGGV
jgi:hypothetical protein